jgi:hypothetical protein
VKRKGTTVRECLKEAWSKEQELMNKKWISGVTVG